MNDRIPLKSRLLAAAIHLTGTIFSGAIGALIPVYLLGSILLSDPLVLAILWFTFMITSCLLWIFTPSMNHFVDCARRDVSNTLINSFLGTTICITSVVFVFWTTCGMGSEDTNPLGISLIITYVVASGYFLHSVIAAIFALRGYRFVNRLIYPFFREE
jgi:hypothetical protein